MLMAFLAYRSQFDTRLSELISKYFDFKMLSLHAERLADVVLTKPEPMGPLLLGQDRTQQKTPSLRISDLEFRYSEQDPWILQDLNLQIEPGESVAIVGESGCGKSTLAALLLGVYKPQTGAIEVGGVPLDRLGLSAWRAMVGTVTQDDTLFAGSVADNISFFDAQPDYERLAECARLACIHEDIEMMAMGYQTLVGDMGTVLSRALYKQPQILILDEATSHLDVKTETKVTQAIAQLNMTRVIIAHRPETIGAARRVVELDGGKVVFDGQPAAYLRRLGIAHRQGEA
jgi:ATP-binding cassette subfamily B protein RaxB